MRNNIVFLVFKKELLDIFRDKKTFILSILIPLLLIPGIMLVMSKTTSSAQKSMENNIKIALKDDGKSKLGEFLRQQKNLQIIEYNGDKTLIEKGEAALALTISKEFDEKIVSEQPAPITLFYDNSGQQSSMAANMINSYIDAFSKQIVAQRLSKKNINPEILTPIKLEEITTTKKEEGLSKLIIAMLIPLLLIIYSITGPMSAAVDLGAGEKERGTLEPLLTTKAGRMSLLWGKFLAVTCLGFITVCCALAGIIGYMQFNPGFFMEGSGNTAAPMFKPITLLLIGIIGVLTTMVFGALELSISIYARSFKEAQTYLTPLTIIGMVPAYATYMLDPKTISGVYYHIPLANATCLLKELLYGVYNYNHIAITMVWIVIYIVASLLFARYMFGREEVIFRT